MSAEIHVPISPTPGFFTRARLLASSVRANAGALADARIVVTVSRDRAPYDIAAEQPWSRALGVEWRWVDAQAWAQHGIFATALTRFAYDFEAPFVVLLDADTLVTGPLDDLLELADHDAVGGVVAHLPPHAMTFRDGVELRGETFWNELHWRARLIPPQLACAHTAPAGVPEDERACPAYFNLGMIAGGAATMRRIGATILREVTAVDAFAETFFRCQLAVTLAIARTGCAWSALPVRWNFPNDDAFWQAYTEDRADIRVLHYLRDHQIDRERDLGSQAGLDALLDRDDLSPVNRFLQAHVAGGAAVHA